MGDSHWAKKDLPGSILRADREGRKVARGGATTYQAGCPLIYSDALVSCVE